MEWNILKSAPDPRLSDDKTKSVQNFQSANRIDSDPAAPPPVFIGSKSFRSSAFGRNHPLSIVRHAAVLDLVNLLGWLADDRFQTCTPATVDQLLEFHDRAYIRALQHADTAGRVEPVDRDRYQIGTLENPLFPGLFERAASTVGGSILAAELALAGHVVFHPSGGTHHGRPDRACGFCYFNDPVFAINTLLESGMENVMYVDFDAHHGDGVENAFFEDPRVATLSVHEDYRWPYSGSSSRPQNKVFNLSVPRGFNDSEFEFLFDNIVLRLAGSERVEALVVCCGADSLAGDPLSGMLLSNVSLWRAVEQLIALGRPTIVLGGGGYNPWTLTRYWAGMWGRISGHDIPERLPDAAVEILGDMHCDLVDEEDRDPDWLTTMADSPYPGPVREAIKSLVKGVELH